MQRLDAATGVQYFKQTADIDLSGQSWTPFEFGGHFDGNGKTISNVKIDMPNSDNVGFFSKLLSGGEVKNVHLENVNVKGRYSVGALVAVAEGNISNCSSSGSVDGSSDVGGLVGAASGSISNSHAKGKVTSASNSNRVGGLVGSNFGSISNSYTSSNVSGYIQIGGVVGYAYSTSSVSNSHATGSVSGSMQVGGLVGIADFTSSISNSYASGSVSGSTNAGGLVGSTYYSSISNSYASGSVSGFTNVGGLVGVASYGSISNSYASGKVTASSSYVGGLVGHAYYNPSISNSYYDSDTTKQLDDIGRGIPRTTTEMKTGTPSETIYTGWNSAIWDFGSSSDYPTLRK